MTAEGQSMHGFLETLRVQRWDDHRYYHHSRINQSLHLISAISFLCAYVLVVTDPPMAAIVGWLVGMVTRQSGHFFFEPKGYDHVNKATHEHKEEIKVGYNLQRKVVLHAIWAALPLMLLIDPTLLGVFEAPKTFMDYVRHVGWIWLVLGVGGLLFRTIHLFFIQGVMSGLAWATKILTDPFHDIMLYYKAPYYLLQGQLIDPNHGRHGAETDDEVEDEAEPEPALRG